MSNKRIKIRNDKFLRIYLILIIVNTIIFFGLDAYSNYIADNLDRVFWLTPLGIVFAIYSGILFTLFNLFIIYLIIRKVISRSVLILTLINVFLDFVYPKIGLELLPLNILNKIHYPLLYTLYIFQIVFAIHLIHFYFTSKPKGARRK